MQTSIVCASLRQGITTESSSAPSRGAVLAGMHRLRPGRTGEATVIGVTLLILAVVLGKPLAASSFAHYFIFTRTELVLLMAGYGFIASVLPVWLLLAPRDYLSSYMKIGTIALLVLGVVIVNPVLEMPAFSSYIGGGGPVVPGPLFPFAFITIACGAISGFHALISSGTTPKMIDKESDIRVIGYGAMLMEGLVGVMTCVSSCQRSRRLARYRGDSGRTFQSTNASTTGTRPPTMKRARQP